MSENVTCDLFGFSFLCPCGRFQVIGGGGGGGGGGLFTTSHFYHKNNNPTPKNILNITQHDKTVSGG